MCPVCLETSHNADERTRTSTESPPHGPEPCASTNSATSARAGPNIAHLRETGGRTSSCPSSFYDEHPQSRAWEQVRFASLGPAGHAPLSSRGLGRRPLMAETRVRIPVAVLATPRVYGAFRVLGPSVKRWAKRERASRCVRAPTVAMMWPMLTLRTLVALGGQPGSTSCGSGQGSSGSCTSVMESYSS
jgi:hypothetical protein